MLRQEKYGSHNYNKKNSDSIDQGDDEVLKPLWLTEKEAIIRTLKACQGNRTVCAQILKISKGALYRRMEQYDISL